jgi:hypothetical protein
MMNAAWFCAVVSLITSLPLASFALDSEQLAIWDKEMRRVVEPGKFDILIGPSSAQTDKVELEVTP